MRMSVPRCSSAVAKLCQKVWALMILGQPHPACRHLDPLVAFMAWFCVEGDISPLTARSVKKASIFFSPPAKSWRLRIRWKWT